VEVLGGIRVIDFSTEIAGAYCTKLLADAGADVIKVEPATGDPFRRRTWTQADLGTRDSALFRFLHAGKRSVVGCPGEAEITDLIASADLVVESFDPPILDVRRLRDACPALVILSISRFGRTGPWADRPATEFTVQAESGAIAVRGPIERPPLQAPGRVFDWIAGAYGAVGALAAVQRARKTGAGEYVDCSLLETANIAGTSHMEILHWAAGNPPIDTPLRLIEAPSIEPTADGWVGLNTNMRQHFDDFLVMIERSDLLGDDEWAMAASRLTRLPEWNEIVHAWTRLHTTAEIIRRASLLRIPVAPVNDGASVVEHEQFSARGLFVTSPDGTFIHPLPPYILNGDRPHPRGAPPRLGEHTGCIEAHERNRVQTSSRDPRLPLKGLRVLDATQFWAGPSAGKLLAAMGADVIHLESLSRPDGGRLTSAGLRHLPQWWERGFLFVAENTDKRDLTLDLRDPAGFAAFTKLIAECDVVIENYSPRVFENFGITWDLIHAINPATTFVRMPAFGLDGPWRDNVAFAQTIEQITGMAYATGYPDQPPRVLRGPCDPAQGIHGVFALLVALEQRTATGQGSFIEISMAESGVNIAAEYVIENSAYGRLIERDGNRGPDAAPQGLYACRGWENWLAISIADDAQWKALRSVLGDPAWAQDPRLETAAGRHSRHDQIDEGLRAWAAGQDLSKAVDALIAGGVPAGAVLDPRMSASHPQLVARGFAQVVQHSVVGPHPANVAPFIYDSIGPWQPDPAPTLGEHNHHILHGLLGLADAEIARLEQDGVIGTVPDGV
jgi:crotonobetainyl-CoA:carnitine CoA-transferase CaiB-like acyl-CoA transferase